MTGKQVADYFEVDFETVKWQYKNNRDEFDEDGVHTKKPFDMRSLSGSQTPTLKMAQRRGFLEITLSDNTTVAIPNCGVKCFPKRAVLRMGMLLRDSVVAKEVRTQLLNTFEHATIEQRTTEINKEEDLVGSIIKSALKGETQNVLTTFTDYIGYKNRYIAKIEKHNAELTKKNEEVTSDNKALTAENDIYAKDVLKWADRASANRAVRVLANMCFLGRFEYAWNTIYKELAYKYGIAVKIRASHDTRKRSLLSYIKDDEWIYVFKEIAALCNQNKGDVKKLFADAKINIPTDVSV